MRTGTLAFALCERDLRRPLQLVPVDARWEELGELRAEHQHEGTGADGHHHISALLLAKMVLVRNSTDLEPHWPSALDPSRPGGREPH